MDPITAAVAATTAISTVNSAIKTKNEVKEFGELVKSIKELEATVDDKMEQHRQASRISLSSNLGRSFITSKVFIQDNVKSEDIINDLLQVICNTYISWILAAVNLNNKLTSADSSSIKNLLGVIASRDDLEPYISKESIFSDLVKSNEASNNKNTSDENKPEPTPTPYVRGADVNERFFLPLGRLVEISFKAGGNEIAANIIVQLLPSVIDNLVAKEFFTIGAKAHANKRWFQVKTGEIKFIRDFLFELDLLDNRTKAIKADRTGALKEMLDVKKNALARKNKRLKDIALKKDNISQNIANTVHIYDKNDFDSFCSTSGYDFKNYQDRENFFTNTLSMMVVVIDTSYSTVDFYYFGVENKSTFNFNQLRQQAKTESYDLMSMAKAMYNATAPKY